MSEAHQIAHNGEQFMKLLRGDVVTDYDVNTCLKAGDTMWRTLVLSESTPPTKQRNVHIEVGKLVVSEADRWKLQAELRRQEVRDKGQQYNKKLMRPIKSTKGPTPGEAFPAGRGRPVHK